MRIALAQRHDQPNGKRLVVLESLNRALRASRAGLMDFAHRLIQADNHLLVQRLPDGGGMREHVVDGSHEVPRGDLCRGGIYRYPFPLEQ